MTYAGLKSMYNNLEPHLGGNIIEGDPLTFSPNVWNYVIERFAIESVLDLGSGLGYSSDYFFKKGLKVVAIDGMAENIECALYPTVQFDLTKGVINCKVHLVHCHEVVEHIEEKFLENVLKSLTSGKIILLTNALPSQGGIHHVNEQPTEYWIKHLERYNCHLLVEDTNRIRNIAKAEGSVYLANTGTLFSNRNWVK
jgi:SAM-dependent methyltransferase